MIRSVAEAAYVIYMLNYFKTTYNFSTKSSGCHYFEHQTGHSQVPQSFICPFGNNVSWVFAAYLLGRHAFKRNRLVNNIVLGSGVLASLMNANVFIYLLPVFALEAIY